MEALDQQRQSTKKSLPAGAIHIWTLPRKAEYMPANRSVQNKMLKTLWHKGGRPYMLVNFHNSKQYRTEETISAAAQTRARNFGGDTLPWSSIKRNTPIRRLRT
jgi:hypothetical protein